MCSESVFPNENGKLRSLLPKFAILILFFVFQYSYYYKLLGPDPGIHFLLDSILLQHEEISYRWHQNLEKSTSSTPLKSCKVTSSAPFIPTTTV